VSVPAGTPANDEIARVAYAIWEAEGQPEGRDHEHWMRAKQLIAEGRAEVEFPQAAGPREDDAGAPQPGFRNVAPATVPKPRELPAASAEAGSGHPEMPGPRDPDPEPATNAEGYVAVPSATEVGAGALNDDPQALTPEPRPKRGRAGGAAAL